MPSTPATGFLPDFCSPRATFLLVLIAQLLAMLLALAQSGPLQEFWPRLALISLFVQWIALATALLLCIGRRWLQRLGTAAATTVTLSLMLGVCAGVSLTAAWLGALAEIGPLDLGFVLRNLLITVIVGGVALRYFYVQHQWRQNVAAEARAREQALKARIRPHFLFNSLNAIASLTRSRPAAAEAMVEDLAEIFRGTLASRDRVTLEDEIELTRRYLNIESARLGPRLRVEWRLDPKLPQGLRVPSLILQPLAENAVYHGIEPAAAGGTVVIAAGLANGRLTLSVGNPKSAGDAKRAGNRLAQENIRERLALAYGENGRMQIEDDGRNYRVTLQLPLETRA
jgi:two-component system sensor histidine kinase AlgZ